MTKPELRKVIRVRIEAIPPEERDVKSAAICREIAATPEWSAARRIGFFSPLRSEPDVHLLWAVLGNRTVCYPRIVGESLAFYEVPDRESLLESRWSLLEPEHSDDRLVSFDQIDLLLVPGVAFTADGHRMGRGKGYYDRVLASESLRGALFGVCFAEQLVPHLPMEPHDRPVSRVFSA